MNRIIKYIVLLTSIISLTGCQEDKNEYLGNLDLSYQAYVNDEKMDSEELEFYYGYALMKYINGYYTAFDDDGFNMLSFTIGEDINSLKEQTCTAEGYENETWEYYFVKQATLVYQEIHSLSNEAEKQGYKITKEDTKKAQDAYKSITTYCEDNTIDITDYLHSTFGKNMTKDLLISYYQKIEMAQRYAETLWVEPTDEQIESYYEIYKDDIDTINIRYFAFDKDKKEDAESFKNAITNEEDFKELAITYSDDETKEYYKNNDLTLRKYLRKEDIPEYLQEALFSVDAIGKTVVVEGTTSYDVVMVISREKPTYQQAKVSTIYLDARESNNDTLTDEKMQASKSFAEELLTNFKAEENPSLEIFHEYNKKYSDDKNNQGDYDAVARGDSTKEIETWVFEELREVGDTAVLPSTYGYSVVYFRGYGEVDYYQRTKELTVTKMYDEKLETLKKELKITIKKK